MYVENSEGMNIVKSATVLRSTRKVTNCNVCMQYGVMLCRHLKDANRDIGIPKHKTPLEVGRVETSHRAVGVGNMGLQTLHAWTLRVSDTGRSVNLWA